MVSRRAAGAARILARVLGLLWWLAVTAGVAAAVFLSVVIASGGDARVSMPALFTEVGGGPRLIGGRQGVGGVDLSGLAGTVSMTVPAKVGLVVLAVVIVAMVFFLAVLWQTRGLFASLAGGTPFAAGNPRRIRVIAVLVAAGEVGRAGLAWASGNWLRAHVSVVGLAVQPSFRPSWEVLALAVLLWLLAEVFALGTRLQHDHDLTV